MKRLFRLQRLFEKLKGVPQSPDEVYKSTYKVDSAGKVTYGRMTYATFMLPNGQPWSAPAPGSTNYTLREPLPDVSGVSCSLPAESSIAAVCLSSCLTPEQSIQIEATDVLWVEHRRCLKAIRAEERRSRA